MKIVSTFPELSLDICDTFNWFLYSVIVVGFERNFTSVDERNGSFELCVQIFTDPDLLPAHTNFTFSLALATVSGTAGTIIT